MELMQALKLAGVHESKITDADGKVTGKFGKTDVEKLLHIGEPLKRDSSSIKGASRGNHARLRNLAVVKPGRVMCELAGVSEPLAREAILLAAHKLPVKSKFVLRED